jgi:hypothetical protein
MDKVTFLSKISEIGTCEDEVERRSLLTTLSDEVSQVFDDYNTRQETIDSLNETIEKNKTDMDKLRETNMSLFLRVTENKPQDNSGSTGIQDPEPNKRKFEDLFKEGGN